MKYDFEFSIYGAARAEVQRSHLCLEIRQGAEIFRFRNNTIIKKAGPVNKILYMREKKEEWGGQNQGTEA